MTMEELKDRWMNWMAKEDRAMTLEDVNDFCNKYATSYEEYMAIQNILEDFLESFEGMPEH